ncbi:hypothetical protein Lbru_1061 [Legionella brunensis]|uniref:Uncharacterized protein n=1 Tax=Legionella brunensis TaxID=29422 RepID=A0A0W0SNF8_9GAMM|nr:hypothetical protein Lbru_1061 [Legionella brunensis]
MEVMALKPAVIRSLMGFLPTLFRVTSNITGLEMPRAVRVPYTFAEFFESTSTLLRYKRSSWKVGDIKKNFSFKCLSSSGIPVIMSAILIVAFTLLFSGFSLSITREPLTYYLPVCVENPRCLICQRT